MANTGALASDAFPTHDGPISPDATGTLAAAPTLPTRWLPRPRPLRVLRAAASRRIVLVRGPAAYGKSALVAHWARSTGRPIAWVSFDRSDDHPDRVASRVAAAIDRVAPGVMPETRGHPDTDAVTVLCGAIERAAVHALVLDDLDELSDAATLDTVRRLLSSMPASAKTIAIARGAPPALPVARWRWRDELADLGAETLAFTRDETAGYLRDAWGWPADAATVDRVWTRTGGWPAALHLIAARASRTGDEVLDGDDAHAFSAAVLDGEDPDDVAWLVRCAVLDVLHAETCADIAGGDAAERLERLARRGLVVQGPARGYRHLPLLRDVLREELRTRFPVESDRLWQEAIRSQAQRGDPVGAVTTARRQGRRTLALDVLDAHRNAIAASDGGVTLRRLAPSFDGDALATRPALVTTLVDLAALSRDVPRLTELRAALPPPHDEPTAAAATHAEAALARLTGAGRHGVVTTSSDDDSATLRHLRGVEAGWDGDHARAEALLRRALADAGRRGDPVRQLVVLSDLAWECARAGRVPVAELLARQAVALSSRLRLDRPPLVVQLARAWIALDRGRRDRAAQLATHIARASAARRDPTLAFEAVMTQLRVDDDPGATNRALRALGSLMIAHHGRWGGALARRLARAQATLRLRSGRRAEAADWVLTADGDGHIRPADRLLLARVLLRQGHPARARAQAVAVTPEVAGPRLAAAAALVEAAAARAAGDRRAAIDATRRARVTAIAHSLASTAARRVPPFRPVQDPASRSGARPAARMAPAPTPQTEDRSPPVELLTQRELDVLRLLPSGLSYKGMAHELAVTLNTVKTHLKSVYRKLGARSRYEALNRAGELGLIGAAVTPPVPAARTDGPRV